MGAGAVPAIADTESEVSRLFRQWVVLDAAEAQSYAKDDEAGQDEATERKMAIERQMQDAPKTSPADVALALAACTDFGQFELGWERGAELRTSVREMLAA